ncbi:uncharacterized protein SPPG_00206 [Spizellomyces punctatus DAOM BR117]|uniref:STIL N-terminal domain-containing protein n=1 Tax=Spizellomyces punctatus (strain DAOM BR117) TaxID=645134 RepID=A0A0L0HUD0_SPIPD|nr:uncharacterized protein SPPG_00206 [Spizellomyces punctatus DAOM BR117]KND04479.1 hypothetical protein SPPG_00206 [Spizellomyces punctatus DAOM BR117]|eukprot:XP_016612518.1 hypothetical protein SPPG_00206 [Spizellomyces punctatus DAOM BR117]
MVYLDPTANGISSRYIVKPMEHDIMLPRPEPPAPHPHPALESHNRYGSAIQNLNAGAPAPVSSTVRARAMQLQLQRTDARAMRNGRVRVAAGSATKTTGKSGGGPVSVEDGGKAPFVVQSATMRMSLNEETPFPPRVDRKTSSVNAVRVPYQGRNIATNYKFVPPAAAKYYLWDTTSVGPTHLLTSDQLCPDNIRLQTTAIRASLSLDRPPVATTWQGVMLQGFFIGRYVPLQSSVILESVHQLSTKALVLDRFDAGRRSSHTEVGLEPTFVTGGDAVVTVLRRVHDDKEMMSQETGCWSSMEYGYVFNTLRERLKRLDDCANLDIATVVLSMDLDKSFQLQGLKCQALIPDVILRAHLINPLMIVPTTLTTDLLKPLSVAGEQVDSGYVAIDQARHVLTLTCNDPMATSLPLAGIWVKGARHIRDPSVQCACIRYIWNSVIKKLDMGKSQVLVIIFQNFTSGTPQFYECNYEISEIPFALYEASLPVPKDEHKGDLKAWQDVLSVNNGFELKKVNIREYSGACEAIESVFDIPVAKRQVSSLSPPAAVVKSSASPLRVADDKNVADIAITVDTNASIPWSSTDDANASAPSSSTDQAEDRASFCDDPGQSVRVDQEPKTTAVSVPRQGDTTQTNDNEDVVVNAVSEQQQSYLKFLQLQLDMLKMQMSGKQAASSSKLQFWPMIPMFPSPVMLTTSTSSDPVTRRTDARIGTGCDAATNTTVYVGHDDVQAPFSSKESQQAAENKETQIHAVSEKADSSPPTRRKSNNAPAVTPTLGTTDLESVLKRINQTDIERTYHLPADTGSNYEAFFQYDPITDEEEKQTQEDIVPGHMDIEQDGNEIAIKSSLIQGRSESIKRPTSTDETKSPPTADGHCMRSEIREVTEGRTPVGTLLRRVAEVLEKSHEDPLQDDVAVNVSSVEEVGEGKTELIHNRSVHGAKDIIARLASHPEQSFIVMADHGDFPCENLVEQSVVLNTPRKQTIRSSPAVDRNDVTAIVRNSKPTQLTASQNKNETTLYPVIASKMEPIYRKNPRSPLKILQNSNLKAAESDPDTTCEQFSRATLEYLHKYGLLDAEEIPDVRVAFQTLNTNRTDLQDSVRGDGDAYTRILDITRIQTLPKLH